MKTYDDLKSKWGRRAIVFAVIAAIAAIAFLASGGLTPSDQPTAIAESVNK